MEEAETKKWESELLGEGVPRNSRPPTVSWGGGHVVAHLSE